MLRICLGLILYFFVLSTVQSERYDRESETYKNNYIGCFIDTEKRDLNGVMEDFGNENTVEKCVEYCAAMNYKYAGVQYGIQCFCGNSYGVYHRGKEADCNYECPGDSKEHCGGYWRNSIYEVTSN